MMMCNRCKKNVAVVFINKIEHGKTSSEGLCIACAQKMGIANMEQLTNALGLKPGDINNFEGQIGDMLEMAGANPEDMTEEELDMALGGSENEDENPFKDFFGGILGSSPQKGGKESTVKQNNKKKKKKIIDMYGENLTAKARQGLVDRVIGRESEITRCIEILNRRSKNNPCLIGDPGVGKTAIAEGLAAKIAEGDVPAKLLDYEVYLLDFTAIVAGTQFRGQFESRLKNIIDEAKKQGNMILVIDELHNIVGAGSSEGAMNAANILKPSLARGEIQVIGATTIDEYRRHIEKDSALERRFQPVMVDEPGISDTIEIIKGIKDYYEDYHKVKITDEVIREATVLSERYITDRFLPDKAIDVIDEAASCANLRSKEIAALARLKNELAKVQASKETAVQEDSIENYQIAADLKMKECRLNEQINTLTAALKDIYLTREDVAAVIERWTKIPASSITKAETSRLLELEGILEKRVIGQTDAVAAVAAAIRRSRVYLAKKRRPASFIFAGSTGVGKTELVLALAEAMFDTEEALIRLDMSEYMEKHSVSKIIGSPPGYVGYDDAGQLTEKVRRKPYSVILLDEIEKAHADVMNIMLQILEDGRITDSHGKMVSFENTIIVMTTNCGSDYKGTAPGYTANPSAASSAKVTEALKDYFRPEFLNRVDEIVVFKALEKDTLLKILQKLIGEFKDALENREIGFKLDEAGENLLLDMGYDPKNGARPLRRVVQKQLEDKAAQLMIGGKLLSGKTLSVTGKNGKIEIDIR